MRPNRHKLPTLLMAVVLSWSMIFLSCASTPQNCETADSIDAWYQRTIAERCASKGLNTEDCPAMAEIEREYDRRYDERVKCRNP